MSTTTPARDRLHAFYAANPGVECANGEQLLALPDALTSELAALLTAATLEKAADALKQSVAERLHIDPAAGIREIAIAPGGMSGNIRVFTAGRNAKGRFATWDAIRLTVTARGHWYRSDDPMDTFSNDRLCRGCGHHGHFDYILDYERCAQPATGKDIQAAFGR